MGCYCTTARTEKFNEWLVHDELTYNGYYAGKPFPAYRGFLLSAFDEDGGGHIWFCDGYYEQAFEVKKKFLFVVVDKWIEYDDRIYMNWGWGPNGGNGWYCAIDTYWTSDQNTVEIKTNPKMYVGLDHYESKTETF